MADWRWLHVDPVDYAAWIDMVNADPAFAPEDPLTPPSTPEPAQDSMAAAAARVHKARAWIFVINNPQEHGVTAADLVDRLTGNVKYAVWQLEVGANGTPHFQGYVEFKNPRAVAGIKTLFGCDSMHLEKRNGTATQARNYAMKEETRAEGDDVGPWEVGTFEEPEPGKRNDLHEFRDRVLSGASELDLLDEFPHVLARHPHFAATIKRIKVSADTNKVELPEPYPWQEAVINMVNEEPNSREILWVYDNVGNTGKTHLCRYLVDHKGAFYTTNGKGADISYAYQGQGIVCFDFSRDTEERVNYSIIEQIKNGILFSPKYESGQKRFNHPHIIVMANFMPDRSKLSADRWVIIEILPDKVALLHD